MTNPDRALEFEVTVMKMINRAVRSGALGLAASHATVHHRKAYYSGERGSPIVFDVAIEVCRQGATEPFLLWVWECKNYGRSVPVDDVEEFHAKLQQIGSDRTKGSIAAASCFQSGAVEYARTHGIGIVRVLNRRRMIFDLEDSGTVMPEQIEACLREPDIEVDAELSGATSRAEMVSEMSAFIRLESAG